MIAIPIDEAANRLPEPTKGRSSLIGQYVSPMQDSWQIHLALTLHIWHFSF